MHSRYEENWWWDYCDEFSYFSKETIRDGCHPRKMVQPSGADRAVVLVHGLTDSSYYMTDLANYFYHSLGYNVFMPLLQCHGLKDPRGMRGVSLAEWKKNVTFAIDSAAMESDYIAIGGLSTGGALAFNAAYQHPKVTGGIYLFSAALGLYGGCFPGLGKIKERLLRYARFGLFDLDKNLVGKTPYRYERVPLKSARELSILIKENEELRNARKAEGSFSKPIFSVWTECDRVIDGKTLARLASEIDSPRFFQFVISEKYQLEHACVTLEEPVWAIGDTVRTIPLEPANPLFAEMLQALGQFSRDL